MRATKISTLAALVLAPLVACEPPDTGGGAGQGGNVAFIRGGKLVLSKDDGTGEKFITEANTSAEPAYTANGSAIAFSYNATPDATSRGIYSISVTGDSLPTKVCEPASADETYSSPTYSPDGQTIVFISTKGGDRKLMKVAASGGAAEEVPGSVTTVNFPIFLDDSTIVVLHGIANEVKKVDLSTGTLTTLEVSSQSRPAVSRDGKRLAYSKSGKIVVMDLATKTETPIVGSGGDDVKPAFSFDQAGDFVAYESGQNLYVSRADGTGTSEPLQQGTDVAWGP